MLNLCNTTGWRRSGRSGSWSTKSCPLTRPRPCGGPKTMGAPPVKPSRRISPPAASRTRRRPLFRASTVRARLIGRPGLGTIKRGVRRRRGSGVDLLPHVRATGIMAHLSEREAGARASCTTGRRTQSRSLDDVERVRDRSDRFTRARRATGPTAPGPPAARGTACGRSASGASGCLRGHPVASAMSRTLLSSASQTATRASAGVSSSVVATRSGSMRWWRPGSTTSTSAATAPRPPRGCAAGPAPGGATRTGRRATPPGQARSGLPAATRETALDRLRTG